MGLGVCLITIGEHVISADEVVEQVRGLRLLRIYWLQYTLAGEALRAYRSGDVERVMEVKRVVDEAKAKLEAYAEAGELGARIYVMQLAGMSQVLAQMLEPREPSGDIRVLAAGVSSGDDVVRLGDELAARVLHAYLAEDVGELRELRALVISVLRGSSPTWWFLERRGGVESFISAAVADLEGGGV
ncbi:MAG: hypothetical protein DRN99_08860 [Thermoproteota archaeon]|nr:MAG: hypothetical protein DRN99_08860 [Candidatus Korarchaeota archaeon]